MLSSYYLILHWTRDRKNHLTSISSNRCEYFMGYATKLGHNFIRNFCDTILLLIILLLILVDW